ncbi:hypothetical protein CcCBS67573_g09674 [Chytriomyces confervae]|uniref:GATA-type domain-containing protein n=1 Tax=Chytriomyces confervae TaxID=246404 RepID=A0A507DQJ4_9FUNG|nr:hypothetical protein CcCBS67573_g09674 [Chytriomyces confervae]
MNAQKPDTTTSSTSSTSNILQQHSHSSETKPNTNDPLFTKQDPTTHIQPLLKHPAPIHTAASTTTTSKTIHPSTPAATTSILPPIPPNPTTTTTKKSRRKKKETEIYKCINCCITETSLWRRDDDGNPICNPCGLYFRLHNKPRRVVVDVPTVIRRRKRLSSIGSVSSAGAGAGAAGAGAAGVGVVVVDVSVKQEENVGGVHAVAGIAGGDGIAGVAGDGVAASVGGNGIAAAVGADGIACVGADGIAAGVGGDGLDKDTDDGDGGLGSTHGEQLRKASIDCSGEDICALLVLANVANAVQASQE